jgi:hypothetical protein
MGIQFQKHQDIKSAITRLTSSGLAVIGHINRLHPAGVVQVGDGGLQVFAPQNPQHNL